MTGYRFDAAGKLVRDVRVRYAFRDLPLGYTPIGEHRFLYGSITGTAECGGDMCEPFVVHELHVDARCPKTSEARPVLLTPSDDLYAPIVAQLTMLRGEAIVRELGKATREAEAATIKSPSQRRLYEDMAASLPGELA